MIYLNGRQNIAKSKGTSQFEELIRNTGLDINNNRYTVR